MYLLSGKNNKKNVLFFNVVSKPEFELVKKHKDFPLYRAPGVLIESVSSNFPLLLLTGIFGPVAAGFYSIAKTVLGIPISLIGSSLGNVLYLKLSETANNDKNIAQLIFKSTLYLTIVAVIPFGLIILLGPWIFSFIFGSDWIIAGEYARWMAVWLYTDFINIPSIKSLPVLSEQRFLLIFMIFSLLFKILGLLAGFYFFESDIVAIALFSIVGALANLVLIGITYIKSRRFDIENTKSL